MLHIVHPEAYRFITENEAVHAGKIPKWAKRDRKIRTLVETALEMHEPIIHHQNSSRRPHLDSLRDLMLIEGSGFFCMYDGRVKIIITTPNGTPLWNEKPPKASQELWTYLCSTYTNEKAMETILEQAGTHLVIGGFYEQCVANFVRYARPFVNQMCVVKELCAQAPSNPDPADEFKKLDVRVITYADALSMIRPATAQL